jgi:hypothetical protein
VISSYVEVGNILLPLVARSTFAAEGQLGKSQLRRLVFRVPSDSLLPTEPGL